MIRCMILDDEPLAIDVIVHHLEGIPDVEVAATETDPVKALHHLREGDFDLLIADVEMPRLTGLELARTLRQGPPVIFTTAHRDHALEGFEVDAVDFLLKPVSLARLLVALDKYRGRTQDSPSEASSGAPAGAPPSEPLFVPSGRRTVRVQPEAILYFESLDDRVLIHSDDGVLETRVRIGQWEDRLRPHGFLRVHRSFLVPLARISSFTSNDVLVDSGQTLPIGRAYRQSIREHLDAGSDARPHSGRSAQFPPFWPPSSQRQP
ncbi:MAG: DNA-binding LytR/AlgR family response regulator [Rhodothermales bacterium]|jgi:DNA-binding LytR/AlgR family response regulator